MNTFGKVLTVLTGAVALSAIDKVVNGVKENENEKSCTANYSHGDAIKAVYENTSYSNARTSLVGKIPVNAPADYYYAVVTAMEYSTYDSERITAVENLNKAYGL